ncbi:MAG: hypothetical protein V3T92_03070 [Anaerolineae bacterium]
MKALLKCFPGREIVVGEGCFVGCDALRAFQRSGYAELAEEYSLRLTKLYQTLDNQS